MDLLLLCAGAADKTFQGAKAHRPLRTRGKRQAQKIGAFLGERRWQPDFVFTSTDLRARVSAEKALKAAGWTAHGLKTCGDLITDFLAKPASAQDRRMLVAPPSGIRALLPRLGLMPEPETGPGILLCVEKNAAGSLLKVSVNPADLPDDFPYPAPDGPERRERPAYYYRQSAVIPYRYMPQGTEILVVGSSGRQHWVVPKGIVEPGLTPAASALKEALEEAGVEGCCKDTPLGRYTYEKWGATCHVEVYAMEVTRELSEEDWKESHRQRQWASAREAATLLAQPAMRDMVLRL